MADSILTDIKKLLGIPADVDVFDTDLVLHINSVFTTLQQLGVGPSTGFQIFGADETWTEFFTGSVIMNNVKTYIYLRVRMLFDPPGTSFVLDSIKTQIQELEWRLTVQRDEIDAAGT